MVSLGTASRSRFVRVLLAHSPVITRDFCCGATRTAKNGTTTTTVRERYTPPDWRADGWFLERRHPTDWCRRTELVLPDHEQAAEADPLVGVHDELFLARLARQKQQGKSV